MAGQPGYERLSRLDAAFLSFETANAPMHVALTLVFQKGPLGRAGGGVDVARIRRHVGARLSRVPRYRQKIQKARLTGDFLWVDDQHFDLDYHVRHTSLPQPGSDIELKERCAEILERPLNRAHPLWEAWIIEGISDGRFALLCKVHHCMVDGVGGMALLQALLSVDPVEPSGVIDGWQPRPAPSESELLASAVKRRQRLIAGARDTLMAAAADPQKARESFVEGATALLEFARRGLKLPETVSFNQPIGPNRRVEWLALDLAQTKSIGTRLAATVNDVALATIAGGFRRFLEGRGQLGGATSLRTVVPVNLRPPGEEASLGNQASCWMIDLPVDQIDPRETLRRIHAQTVVHKSQHSARGGELLTSAAEWANADIMHTVIRALSSAHPYNLIITNVPGPPTPLYLAGAPMLTAHPHLPLFESQGIGLAIFRYVDQLHIGLVGDRDQMPDIGELRYAIDYSFKALVAAAEAAAPAKKQAMAAGSGGH
ncbi:MAG: wax ester/triacylglycerol synthase family O-acyltransferase [Deltaproteobacteria bacterium]